MKKHHRERQNEGNFDSARANYDLHSCYNFQLVLQLYTRVTTLHSCYNFTLVLQFLHYCYNFTLVLQLYTHVTTLHSCYMKNALVFSQGRNFIHVQEKDYAKKTSACPRN